MNCKERYRIIKETQTMIMAAIDATKILNRILDDGLAKMALLNQKVNEFNSRQKAGLN